MACKSRSYTAPTPFKPVASANFRSLPGPNSRCSPCDLKGVETEFQQMKTVKIFNFSKKSMVIVEPFFASCLEALTKPSLCQRSGECKLTGENQPKKTRSQALG